VIFVYCSHQPRDRSDTVIFFFLRKRRYLKRIAALHDSLGIPRDYGQTRRIPVRMEASGLASIGPDIYQREQRLVPAAAAAWRSMKDSASAEGVDLQVVSAYRSVEYQEGILRRKLENGQRIEEILRVSAAPGYSEHHTGRAVDITTPAYPVLEEEFEQSEAFSWLTESAGAYGFHMSFPRDNPHGVAYEPWHWAWRGESKRGRTRIQR
jgi:D-alanyl-D-alanine carboxypeptidase